ncbi:MAG: DUF6049 family protein [Bifidobacterium sp.]|nr:DUF6049 family protein [Bifidobacterium sp.]
MNRRDATGRAARGFWCILLAVIALLLGAATPCVRTAWAVEPDGTAATTGTTQEATDPTGTDGTTVPTADDDPDDTSKPVGLTLTSLTPIVTAASGLKITVTVHNHTQQALAAGSLQVLTNATYHFVSRTDVQQWADGTAAIDTPDLLLNLDVPEVAAGGTATVTGHLEAGDSALAVLHDWGPRPLAVLYASGDGARNARLNTYLTRSQDGLGGAKTPAIGLTVAMPLTTGAWQADGDAEQALITTGSSSATPGAVTSLSSSELTAIKQKDQLRSRFPRLQVVADPDVLADLGTPHISAIMQPDGFDITAYARVNDAAAYEDAGITEQSWNATSALKELRAVLGNDSAEARQVAWQGDDAWTMDALTTARGHGYATVIATDGFNLVDDATAKTEVYRVPTAHGDVTVLAAQQVLSTLASQRATSESATAELSDAGRIERLIAQSAFYQMEQPYAQRSLLVCVDSATGAQTVGAMMEALSGAGWVELRTLDELAESDPAVEPAQMPALINSTVGTTPVDTAGVREALRSLASSREDLERFTRTVLEPEPTADASPAPAKGQALTEREWSDTLMQAHDTFALAALGSDDAQRTAMVDGARGFADAVYAKIKLIPSDDINVVSESATMTVTVSNGLPYEVGVRVSSITDSMEIVTSRFSDVTVPAHSEAQTSFTIRVSTSGKTVAHEQLLDRDGQAFGSPASTTITSSLQISDKSGFVFIALAVLLGVIGLYRQYTRKKDPDE